MHEKERYHLRMHNPFSQSEKLLTLLESLQKGWDGQSYVQLMLAIECEVFIARSLKMKPRLFKTGRLIEAIDWLSQNWATAPSLSLRLRGFLVTHAICDLAAETAPATSNRSRFTDFSKVLQSEWIKALAKKEILAQQAMQEFGDGDAWLAWYLFEMFGIEFPQIKLLLNLCSEKPAHPGPSLYGLLSQKMTLTDIRELAFGDAVRDLQEVQIFIDSRISRPSAVVAPDGYTALFLSVDATNCPIEAAKIAHEWAHIHHMRTLFKQGPEKAFMTSTFEKERFAVRKEFEFLERLPSKDNHNILNAWVKQNLIDTLLEFKQNLVWLTNLNMPCVESAALVPLEAAVYALATQDVTQKQ